MTLIHSLWAINGLAFLIAFYFFLNGLRGATRSAYFSTWFMILKGLALGSAGSYLCFAYQYQALALSLASIPATAVLIVTTCFLLLMSVMLQDKDKISWR
ncbi:hypothetical protein [Spirosoma fluminis]